MKNIKLFETIKVLDGVPFYLDFHEKRLNKARQDLLGFNDSLELKKKLKPPSKGLYKTRIIYTQGIEKIEYLPYKKRDLKSFKLIKSNISYSYKFLDREELNYLFSLREEADDIIIIKNGLITDTFFANLAFFDGSDWLTPQIPLLKGTTRERLLKDKFIIEANLRVKDLKRIKKIAIMNSMLGFYQVPEMKIW